MSDTHAPRSRSRSATRGPQRNISGSGWQKPELTSRQETVLRAVVTAYVGEAAPVGSRMLSHLLPITLSAASIRNTLADLTRLGLVEKPHVSSGRVPTERGLRVFVDDLLDPTALGEYEMRSLSYPVAAADADAVTFVASQLLSERTRLLGFVVAPRVDRVVLRRVSLVRVSSEKVLVVLVTTTGASHRRVIQDTENLDQADLDAVAALLSERAAGRTLRQVRDTLDHEVRALRRDADRMLARALDLGARALSADAADPEDLVIASWLALLDQPEFRDPDRLRELYAALETKERLLDVLSELCGREGVSVAFGEEVDAPGLRRCALVAAPYGGDDRPLGVVGVIGPHRMDYGRVIPVVDFVSRLITDRLVA